MMSDLRIRNRSRVKDEKINQIIQKKYSSINQSLNLDYETDEWMNTLKHRDWKMLKQLLLRNCKITDKNFTIVAQMQWPCLQTIRLYDNQFTSKSIQKLMFNHSIKKLTDLCLGSNNLGSTGVKLIIKAELPFLKQLWLADCKIGNEGAKDLFKGKWPNLQTLSIASNQIGMDGYIKLASNNNWKQMNQLWSQNNNDQAISVLNFVTSEFQNAQVEKGEFSNQFNSQLESIFQNKFIVE